VADALARAAARGVHCRLLVDAVGSKRMLRRLAPELRRKGVRVHAMLPVHLLRWAVARLDLRNHRKLVIIDGRIAYAGSQNVVDEDYGRRNMVWHDIMVRVTGPVVHSLQAVFLADFYAARDEVVEDESVFPTLDTPGDTVLQALPSGPNYPTESYQRMVVAAIHAAKRGIIITTPYFVPDEATLQALQTAVLRGVAVDVIMPRRSDQVLVGAASRAYYEPLLEAGVRVHLYDRGLLHAKTISFDDAIAFIGSSNFDIRSFALNFELNLALYGPEATRALREKQLRYLNDASQLDLEVWRERAWFREMTQRLAALLSPLL
jgi:cardiolipin synthase